MKILVVSPLASPDMVGGVEAYVERLVDGLAKRGQNVTLCTLREKEGHEVVDNVHRVYLPRSNYSYLAQRNYGKVSKIAFHLTENFSTQYWGAINQLVDSENPDVIFTHSTFGFGCYKAASSRARWVHYVHSYDLACFNQAACGISGHGHCRQQCWLCRAAMQHKHGKIKNNLSSIIYNSHYMQHWFSSTIYRGCASTVLYPYFESGVISRNTQSRIDNVVNLVYVGGLEPRKGIQELCEAVTRLGDRWQLNVLGSGSLEPVLRAASPSNIQFHGRVHGAAKEAFLSHAHVAVVPSIWEEPFGLVALEALARGIPVVASDSGELPHLLSGGEGIIFSRVGSVSSNIVDALRRARENFTSLKASAVRRANQLAPSFDEHFDELLKILKG